MKKYLLMGFMAVAICSCHTTKKAVKSDVQVEKTTDSSVKTEQKSTMTEQSGKRIEVEVKKGENTKIIETHTYYYELPPDSAGHARQGGIKSKETKVTETVINESGKQVSDEQTKKKEDQDLKEAKESKEKEKGKLEEKEQEKQKPAGGWNWFYLLFLVFPLVFIVIKIDWIKAVLLRVKGFLKI